MTSPTSPAEMRTQILEGLTGATGDPKRVVEIARACAERSLSAVTAEFEETFSAPVEVEIETVEITRFADARPMEESFGAMVVVASGNSPDALLMTVDAEAISIALCAMFGADDDLPVIPITRPLSPIERDIARQLFTIFATAFNGAGERSFRLRFPLPEPLTGPDLEKQVLRDGPASRVCFTLRLGESTGRLAVTIPQRVLLELRGDARATSRSGSEWRERFSEEVMRSAVALTATIPVGRLTLAELSHLKVGQVLEIPEEAPSQTKLLSRDRILFRCEFGRLGQNFTVRVIEPFDAKRDLVQELLTA